MQQLVPDTGNEVEGVSIGGAGSGFAEVIPHQVIRTSSTAGGGGGGREGEGGREGGRGERREGRREREGEGGREGGRERKGEGGREGGRGGNTLMLKVS